MNSKTLKQKKRKITSINYITVILTIVLIITSIYMISTFGFSNVYGDSNIEYEYVTVEYGDTLWSIAKNYTPQDKNLQDMIYSIKRHNDNISTLHVGDVIKVPKLYN